ncbi:hypothetical protein ACFVUY_40520 [Kitasatospora sp. NPDC058063]|uniref:hypothetical protein n=1 Tax=unclassified Kitasatospora TaxID=2633591 RepID=UPI0036DD81DF
MSRCSRAGPRVRPRPWENHAHRTRAHPLRPPAARRTGRLALLLSGAVGATPAKATTTGLDGSWACEVPAGYVYDQVSMNRSCSGGGSWNSPQFHLRTPYDGLTACRSTPGFVYDNITWGLACSQISGVQSNQYHLRKPVDGLVACMGTPEFTYDYLVWGTACNLTTGGGQSNAFHLRKPYSGLWACDVPYGFTYSTTTQNTDCSTYRNTPSTKFLLLG